MAAFAPPTREATMSRWAALSALLVLALGATAHAEPERKKLDLSFGMDDALRLRLAQGQQADDEPVPPAGEEPTTPGAPGPGEPAAPGTGEPGAPQPGEPTPPPAPPTVVAKPKGDVSYGGGLHVRGLFVPTWFLNMFLDHSTPLNSAGLGAEFVRRKGNFDIVATINFGFYSPEDGNYLGNGKNPADDTDYIQFRNLNVLAFDVAFIGHHYFLPWLSLIYGAGLGLGIVLGDIYRISNYIQKCSHDNLDDLGQCNPVPPGDTGSLNRWNEDRDRWLADGCHQDGKDSPMSPCQFREEDVWPVVPVVHLLLGVNFKINEQFSVRVDGGFHNAFYFGVGGHYFFYTH